MTWVTGCRITLDCPRSPPSAAVSQSHQRATNDLSTPRFSRSRASVSASAPRAAVPAYALTGSKGEAAAIAAYRRTAQQEAAISAAHRKMARAIDAGESTVDADYEFHSAIATATNNRFYLEALRQFGSRSIPRGQFPTLPETGDANYLRKVQAEHEAILRAIVEQDPDAARKAMREHMLASQRRYRLLAEAQ